MSFANSPFADSPHVSEPSAKSAKSKKKASKAQRSKKAADTTQAEKQPDADTAAETEQVATSQDDDETLIEPAALAPEGEPAGDEDEADESGLFAQELQPEDDEREVLSEEEENRRYLKGILQALLFSSDKPLSGRELARAARITRNERCNFCWSCAKSTDIAASTSPKLVAASCFVRTRRTGLTCKRRSRCGPCV